MNFANDATINDISVSGSCTCYLGGRLLDLSPNYASQEVQFGFVVSGPSLTAMANAGLYSDVSAAIDAAPLTSRERSALRWHIAGFELAKLAKELGVSRQAASQALWRAQAKVAKVVGKC